MHRRIFPDREVVDGAVQPAADFGEELPADECRRITGVPDLIHPVNPLDDPGEVGIRSRRKGVDIVVRNGNAKRHLAPGSDHPSGEAAIRSPPP